MSEHLPVSRPINLKGHAAIVTGSARGIGRAIAIALAREGADVTVPTCCSHLVASPSQPFISAPLSSIEGYQRDLRSEGVGLRNL